MKTMSEVSSVGSSRKSFDPIFERGLKFVAILVMSLLLLIIFFLYQLAAPAIHEYGWGFLFKSDWNPAKLIFGAYPFIHGTLITSLFALALSVPVSIGTALFLTEIASRQVAAVIGFLVELLAAIPSVVYGLWGLTVLAPRVRVTVQPWLSEHLSFIPGFSGMPYGVGVFSASIVLAIMITPTITSISREVFRAVPHAQREAALAIGATHSEMIWLSVVRVSWSGVFGAVVLGLGRALGETMAVTMLIGNRNEVANSFFSPAQTMASLIANEYPEATNPLHIGALAYIGLILFGISFIVQGVARRIVNRVAHQSGGGA